MPSIGVVLYARSFCVSRVGSDGWPKVATDHGIEAPSLHICGISLSVYDVYIYIYVLYMCE